jgi:tetratricopeptide (TPR) repeat protein
MSDATQRARELGLEGRFDEAHAILDGLDQDDPSVAIERGRLYRTAGDSERARPYFEQAATAHDPDLRVDALHMIALVVPQEEQVAAHLHALEVARAESPTWVASLLNNLGVTYADLGDWPDALRTFEEALAERELRSGAEEIRIAKWMIAWALRNLGRTDEARTIQVALKHELDSEGLADPYVDEELALLG